jgi:hypothetical protein
MTLEKLAFESGQISKGHLSDVEKGLVIPTVGSLDALAECLEVLLIDLVACPENSLRERMVELSRHASEPMLRRWQEEAEQARPGRDGAGAPLRSPGKTPVIHEKKPRNGVPLVDLAAAAGVLGAGKAVSQLGWLKLDAASHKLPGAFVARVAGTSMEPRIPDGSYVLFRKPGPGNRQGRVMLVQRREPTDPEEGGAYLLKIYERTRIGGQEFVQLRSLDPSVEILQIDPGKVEIRAIADFVKVVG